MKRALIEELQKVESGMKYFPKDSLAYQNFQARKDLLVSKLIKLDREKGGM